MGQQQARNLIWRRRVAASLLEAPSRPCKVPIDQLRLTRGREGDTAYRSFCSSIGQEIA